MVVEAFRAIDGDSNRGIDLNEFFEAGKIVHNHDPKEWTYDKCKRHFNRIDANKNGSISSDEFADFLLKVTKKMDDAQFTTMIESYLSVRNQPKQAPGSMDHDFSSIIG